jgi:hypothetical protein
MLLFEDDKATTISSNTTENQPRTDGVLIQKRQKLPEIRRFKREVLGAGLAFGISVTGSSIENVLEKVRDRLCGIAD